MCFQFYTLPISLMVRNMKVFLLPHPVVFFAVNIIPFLASSISWDLYMFLSSSGSLKKLCFYGNWASAGHWPLFSWNLLSLRGDANGLTQYCRGHWLAAAVMCWSCIQRLERPPELLRLIVVDWRSKDFCNFIHIFFLFL